MVYTSATSYSFQSFEDVDLLTVALTGQTPKFIYQDNSCLSNSFNWGPRLQFSKTCRPLAEKEKHSVPCWPTSLLKRQSHKTSSM